MKIQSTNIAQQYQVIRQKSEEICLPLETEDYVIQPMPDVSPPKWHLGHTTWFFETFILKPFKAGYEEFNPEYNFVFNSYYQTVGKRVLRTDRGNLSRPSVTDIYAYRRYVDWAMDKLLQETEGRSKILHLVILGLNHEQQHQELLVTDIKYILGHNPLFPAYNKTHVQQSEPADKAGEMMTIEEGVYQVGYTGEGFHWDNEKGVHKVYLNKFEISRQLVTNGEYMEFIQDGGYTDFKYWHAEGWDWVKANQIKAPLYWYLQEDRWINYTLNGLEEIKNDNAVCHISYFEAYAFANWKGMRLPTEFEWEVAAANLDWGVRWEWTDSAYLPYPFYQKAEGALGEYNGKFMVNQHVLRGASVATPQGHSRITYRNFFQTGSRWQFTGIRLAK